jgi:Family of unknown function (DUF6492)
MRHVTYRPGVEERFGAGPDHPRSLGPGDVAVVTVSYRGDLEVARDLCLSVDRFLAPEIEHILVVPRVDLALFEPLAGGRRRIVTVESVLPRGYVQLPVPRKIRIGPFHRRIREVWSGSGRLVRGWIIQQIVKLSAPSFTDREVVVFADSDIVLVAPLTADRLVRGGLVRLYRVPGASSDLPTHIRWHDVSARLLGLEPRGYLGADYIGNLITWRRSTIVRLQERVSEVAGGLRWDKVVARQRDFSEYMLYGVFGEVLLREPESGHYGTAEDLVHAGWFFDLGSASGVDEFVEGFTPGQVGVAIQSTERFSLDERRELVRRATEMDSPSGNQPAL